VAGQHGRAGRDAVDPGQPPRERAGPVRPQAAHLLGQRRIGDQADVGRGLAAVVRAPDADDQPSQVRAGAGAHIQQPPLVGCAQQPRRPVRARPVRAARSAPARSAPAPSAPRPGVTLTRSHGPPALPPAARSLPGHGFR
jgi:hypothetical protein